MTGKTAQSRSIVLFRPVTAQLQFLPTLGPPQQSHPLSPHRQSGLWPYHTQADQTEILLIVSILVIVITVSTDSFNSFVQLISAIIKT